jgi:hypothetical protein
MPVLIPVGKLQEQCDPLADPPWEDCDEPITLEDIRQAITSGKLEASPARYEQLKLVPPIGCEPLDTPEKHRRYHIERIAYLAVNGWDDSIDLDVGVPSMQCYVDWIVQDGNHRLAAALYRKDEVISAMVGGSIEYGFELFGVDVKEPTYSFVDLRRGTFV